MGQQYTHLSLFERQRLFEWYHREKRSIREIGRLLGRSHSTISREIRRNMSNYYVPTYYPNVAHRYYQVKVRKRVKRPRLKTIEMQRHVSEKLKAGWTPEVISGRLKKEKSAVYVNHESIYQYIYKEARELIQYLPRKHKKRRKKYPVRKYAEKTSHKTSILERPESINNRSEAGHWESDTVECKTRKGGLNVVLERTFRLIRITKLPSKKSIDTKNALKQKLSKLPGSFVKSVTYDNGPENARHIETNSDLSCESYFCQPYHSWEKGAVEQVNGLIRRFLPKGTDISNIHHSSIRKIENLLNNRPRKCLGYKTPNEAYTEFYGALPP
jgi:IS30 family transposase